MRKVITLVFLVINSYTDIREKSVYIRTVLFQALLGMGLLCYEMSAINSVRIRQILMVYLIIPVMVGAVLICISKLTKGEIGEGDGLVLTATGICIGAEELVCVFIYSSIICGIYALALILTKMASRGKKIPLMPFVLTGCVVRFAQVLL